MDLAGLIKELDRTQWEKREYPPLKGPILTRYDLQKGKAPLGDFVSKTSGATGIPVEVQRTNLSKLWWNATNLREAMWHKRDVSLPIAVIRPSVFREMAEPQWPPAFSLLGKTGPFYAHPVRGDLNAWLQKIQPAYLVTFPSILSDIDLSALPQLKGIKTTGETLQDKHPLIADMYSSEEVGTIAIQCPDNAEVYHVMENIILEILDEQDRPAEEGRVVITDLTSRYLYRYDIGDYAKKGVCTCGRGLQTIQKIFGRKRNRVVLPDGSKHWPLIGSREYRSVALIKRFQVAQIEATTLELRLIVESPLTENQEAALTKIVQAHIGYPFTVLFRYVEAFPPGKFEEFVNVFSK